jgi:1,4-dihydroxy-2-naphthoate octaprenyltransferase
MTKLSYWLLAARPKTLVVALTPLLVGGSLAYADSGTFHIAPWLAALAAALFIQIGTNLHNDAADFDRGADSAGRLGPKRAVAEGWLDAAAVRQGAAISFSIAFLLGIYLVSIGGWPIMLLGLGAIAAGYAYTGGPRPIAYSPLGELFVLLFFGLAAVGGTYYLQTLTLTGSALLAGIVVGLPAAAVLVINNYRDLDSDRLVGKHTLTYFIGRPASRWLYGLMLSASPLLAVFLNPVFPSGWLPLLALPPAVMLISRFWTHPIDAGLNALLARTAQYQLIVGLLLSIGLAL